MPGAPQRCPSAPASGGSHNGNSNGKGKTGLARRTVPVAQRSRSAENAPLGKNQLSRRPTFASHAQLPDASRKNACRYDGSASGPTYYNYFRDYDPAIGRYSQSDPIGIAGGLNTYAYAGNDPIEHVDPDGMVYRPPVIWMPPGWQSTPPGKCSWARYEQLKWDQDDKCGMDFSCDGVTDCADIGRRLTNGWRCRKARLDLMDECFGGGDWRHRRPGGPISQVTRAIEKCAEKYRTLGCCN